MAMTPMGKQSIERGSIENQTIPAQNKLSFTINFSHSFASVPTVVTSVRRTYGSATPNALIAPLVNEVTASYVKIDVYNAHTSDVPNIYVDWIAME